MAFDGITIAAMVSELNKNLSGGRINKIAQPESDELLITGKGANGQKRLLLSASASLPLIYFTGKNRISPLTAPNFACFSASTSEAPGSLRYASLVWSVL